MSNTALVLDDEQNQRDVPEYIIRKGIASKPREMVLGQLTPEQPGTERDANRLSEQPAIVVPVRMPEEKAKSQYKVLGRWEGRIESIPSNGDRFIATIRDLTDPSYPEEEAVFDLDEVTESDRSLLAPGAIFYWIIAYKTNPSSQIERVSFIRLRRVPIWSKKTLQTVHKSAKDLYKVVVDASD